MQPLSAHSGKKIVIKQIVLKKVLPDLSPGCLSYDNSSFCFQYVRQPDCGGGCLFYHREFTSYDMKKALWAGSRCEKMPPKATPPQAGSPEGGILFHYFLVRSGYSRLVLKIIIMVKNG